MSQPKLINQSVIELINNRRPPASQLRPRRRYVIGRPPASGMRTGLRRIANAPSRYLPPTLPVPTVAWIWIKTRHRTASVPTRVSVSHGHGRPAGIYRYGRCDVKSLELTFFPSAEVKGRPVSIRQRASDAPAAMHSAGRHCAVARQILPRTDS